MSMKSDMKRGMSLYTQRDCTQWKDWITKNSTQSRVSRTRVSGLGTCTNHAVEYLYRSAPDRIWLPYYANAATHQPAINKLPRLLTTSSAPSFAVPNEWQEPSKGRMARPFGARRRSHVDKTAKGSVARGELVMWKQGSEWVTLKEPPPVRMAWQ
mmetsp:Transcript_58867/g.164436  ORF Transcript_58867/g.164436 Transcript_58867/m.164436 type:complete len:155 (+) Transcript_58867:77-541(+)